MIGKGKKIAAKLMEAAEADIVFADGRFAVAGTDRALTIKEVARAAFQPGQLPPGVEPGFYETGTFSPKQDTWPNGCHVCEVEIDPDTGAVALVSYVVVDDVGTVINPLTLKGQIHGGVAQGVGQALMEQVVYDGESGQLLTASFMDYAMPRADTLPDMAIASNPVPTKLNPLGAKGAGEAGTVGALAAVINAVMDALAPVGVREFDMPATTSRARHSGSRRAIGNHGSDHSAEDARPRGLDLLFLKARTQNGWLDTRVSDEQPGRFTTSCAWGDERKIPSRSVHFSARPRRRLGCFPPWPRATSTRPGPRR